MQAKYVGERQRKDALAGHSIDPRVILLEDFQP